MRIIKISTLRNYWKAHPAAEAAMSNWVSVVRRASWSSMVDVRDSFRSADIIDSQRIVFDVGGNNWRIVAKAWFPGQEIYIKFIGTHAEYERVNVHKL